jgi:tetratricopeptide (TPR) repeat protein
MYIPYQKAIKVNKKQVGLGVLSLLLFCVLYFVLDTKPKKQQLLEKSRSANLETTGIQIIQNEAKEKISQEELDFITALEVQLNRAENDSLKLKSQEELSSSWFKMGHPALAGYYAEQIAEEKDTDAAWGIAGTTYFYGVQSYTDDRLKQFSHKRAIDALEKAISLDPDNIDYKINKALCYVEIPPEDNPMTGILQLVGLNRENPENVPVLNQLGRLSIQTNQLDKALIRLQTAEELSPDNKTTICLLAQLYSKRNETNLAEKYVKLCEEVIK